MSTDSKMTRDEVMAVLDEVNDQAFASRMCLVRIAVSSLYDEVERLRARLSAEENAHAELQARCFDNGQPSFGSVFDEVGQLRGELEARKEETKADILNIFKLRSELEAAKREVDRQTVGNVIGNAELQSLYDQLEAAKRDAELLRQLDVWADEGMCPHLIFDDNGWWAVTFEGFGPMNIGDEAFKKTVYMTATIEPTAWRQTPQEAIQAAIDAIAKEHQS